MNRILCTIPYTSNMTTWPSGCSVPVGTPLGPFGHALLTALTRNSGDNEDWRSVNWQKPTGQARLEALAARLDAYHLPIQRAVFYGYCYKGEAGENPPSFTLFTRDDTLALDVYLGTNYLWHGDTISYALYWRFREKEELTDEEKWKDSGPPRWEPRRGYTRQVRNDRLTENEAMVLIKNKEEREAQGVLHRPGVDFTDSDWDPFG